MNNAMRYVKMLQDGGFSKEQADTQLRVWQEMSNDNFATKQDIELSSLNLRSEMKEIRSELREVESSIRSDMKDMEHLLRTEIQELRSEVRQMQDKIIIKLSGVMVVMMSATIAAQKLL